jgi:hypothetical protein
MKRFTTEGTNDQEGLGLIPVQSNGEEASEDLSFEGGGLAGARRLSRRQAIGLLGGSLVGVSLLSFGLAAPAKADAGGAGIRGPSGAYHSYPELSAKRNSLNPAWWNLTLEWTCVFFSSEVLNHKWGTNWTLKEHDSTSADDLVTGTVEPNVHSATSATATFIPSQKANPRTVKFTHTRTWDPDDLDTELGGEELYASVRLKDFTLMTPSLEEWSYELPLSP